MSPHPSLRHLAHRPWPLPARPWFLRQTWHDLLFLHWAVPSASVRGLVPAALELQEYSGTAWITVAPFWMSDIGFRNWPALPGLSRFPELNVRTYVNFENRPGVWFFSLDADSRVGVLAARWLYGLPYSYARMSHGRAGEAVTYHSTRPDGAGFAGRYGPTGPVTLSRPGGPEHWLTERYCLYAVRSGGLYRGEIHHQAWPLQPAAAVLSRNDLPVAEGVAVQGPPDLLQFSRKLEVIVWALERVMRA